MTSVHPSLVGRILSDVVLAYVIVLVARAVIDLVLSLNRGYRPTGAAVAVFEVVYTFTDPPLRLLRRLIPPLRIGNAAIDIGFTLLLIALLAIRSTVLQRI